MNKPVVAMLFGMIVLFSLMQPGYSQVKSDATLENGTWYTKVGKQVQVTTDVTNGQDRVQPFAYLVQIQNQDGVVCSLSWILQEHLMQANLLVLRNLGCLLLPEPILHRSLYGQV